MVGIDKANVLKEGMVFNNYLILSREGNFEGEADSRPQWRVRCQICKRESVMVNRYIRRRPCVYCKHKIEVSNGIE